MSHIPNVEPCGTTWNHHVKASCETRLNKDTTGEVHGELTSDQQEAVPHWNSTMDYSYKPSINAEGVAGQLSCSENPKPNARI